MLDYKLGSRLDNYMDNHIMAAYGRTRRETARLGRVEPPRPAGIPAAGAPHLRRRAVCRAARPNAARAKILKGFGGAGVLELVEDHRAIPTARFTPCGSRPRIYVLHVFQKKSKRGIATPKKDIELIRARLKWAERLYTGRTKEG